MHDYLLLTSFLVLVFTACSSDRLTNSEEVKPPNIIFLLADDLRYDMLGVNGNKSFATPGMDKLAKEGINYDSAYVTTSICAVSRASILSGQYASRHKLWGFGKNFNPKALNETYPLVLKDNGYEIGFIGKWGVGNIALVKDSFDFWRGFAHQGTYHHKNEKGEYLHLTDLIGSQIDTFLSTRNKDQPWQLSVSFKAPHVQDGIQDDPKAMFPVARRFEGRFDEISWPKPVAADSKYFSHFPDEFSIGNEARKRWDKRFSTPERYRQSMRGYAGLITGIDEVVQSLRARLEALGMDDNTVIILTSDHGFYLGEYGFAGKWYGSEPSIRIPLVVYDPRGLSQANAGYALNIDMGPTMLNLAGLNAPKMMQGLSVVNTDGHPTNLRDSFLYEHLWPASAYQGYPIPSAQGIVTKDAKYVRYFKGETFEGEMIFEEFYDRHTEVLELNNMVSALGKDSLMHWRAATDQFLKKVQ